ncbi:c-type cytochrome [Massilia cavernae]|uniref:Cytochrome c domain-containing protein n=1 Tax=Massilia cavernae TaxID=2320864 RepID=A0A418XGR1_9BURK|nr:cytochrome c [Massilia cavernae]RJG11625.1 hypothetical protein D3872_18865 [Massilia cavernae]
MMAAPMTYSVGGVQYVAVAAGYGGLVLSSHPPGAAANDYVNRGRMLVFRLDGAATPLPEKRAVQEPNPLPPLTKLTPDQIQRGAELFKTHCVRCHGAGTGPGQSGFPNLFDMQPAIHEAFEAIVLRGAYSYGGMASYADVLKDDDAGALHGYLIDQAHKLRAGARLEPAARVH